MSSVDWSLLKDIGIGSIKGEDLLQAALVLMVCLVVIKLVMVFFDRNIGRLKIEKTLHSFIRSLLKIALLFVSVLIVADTLGIKITSLVALFSVVGLAVSLAVQGTLSNIAGGIMVLTTKPFSAGDYIEAAGVAGTVREIGMVYTAITTIDNKVIYIPNSDISATNIINYTAQTQRRLNMVFQASYEDDIDQVKQAIFQVLEAQKEILSQPDPPFVGIEEYRDSSVAYVLRAWCRTQDYWPLFYRLQEEVRRAFDQKGLTMPYDHVNVHIMKETENGNQV